jgi:hypothetical protein
VITLPTTFRSDGFDFQILNREGEVALLAKKKPKWNFSIYEVVRVQVWPDELIKGRFTPEREAMPRSEQWGVHGWSFADMDDARRKFYELVSVKQRKAARRPRNQVLVSPG